MKGVEFPIFKTKSEATGQSYNFADPSERKKYFEAKAGKQIDDLKRYLRTNTFVAYLLGKKQAGKGTYTKLLAEVFGSDKIRHISVGDLVRETESAQKDPAERKRLTEYLSRNYRGFMSLDDALNAFLNRDTKTLLPTEFILALVKREIENAGRVSLFIDGFPRNMDQITYSLYFRELINYRNDPDMFVLIDVPEKVIDERIKYRRICPKCFTSRNLSLNPSSIVKYDYGLKEFYLMCDNPECTPTRMVGKEGDELGIESIRNRIEMDDKLIRRAFELHGVPKIMLRNSIPTEIADEITDPYEVTEDLEHSIDENGRISTRSKSWEIIDDNGIPSVSLMPPPVVISCIHQLHEILIT